MRTEIEAVIANQSADWRDPCLPLRGEGARRADEVAIPK